MADQKNTRKELEAKLMELNMGQEERLARRRADMFRLPYADLFGYPLDAQSLKFIPQERAREAGAILFYKRGKDVRLATVNPEAEAFEKLWEELAVKIGFKPKIFVMSRHSLRLALGRYPEDENYVRLEEDEISVDAKEMEEFEAAMTDLGKLGERIGAVGPSKILKTVMAGSLKMRASDVHIEPKRNDARLRYRIDGVLQDIAVFALEGWKQMLSRVKVLSDLKLNVHDMPQEGGFVLRVEEQAYDIRTSILPGQFGEYIVMRILSRSDRAFDLKELGMKERDIQVVREQLKQSTGMILTSGPTGSGKTTTIAACLAEVNKPELKIITLEDPVEYRIAGIEQTEIDHESGYTFAVGLRSILRQDPDIIFVGEMRDKETAETSFNAAMTGHLVFSTVHANDAPGVVWRLIDLGIRAFVLAPALDLIVAQRLIRKVCSECAQEYKPEAELKKRILETMEGVSKEYFDPAGLDNPETKFKKATSCQACSGTGYIGRVGVFEIFAVHGELEELVLEKADSNKIRAAAMKQGMTTIAQDAYLKVIEGITTVEEVERISDE